MLSLDKTHFLNDDFMLAGDTACRLYHDVAADQPIYDYHCHLVPADLASNRRYNNLTEIWLEGDHYKWRAMRTHGVAETFITGEADPYDKFLAWARTVPATLRNPLYHWTHLELQRYFGIDLLLNENTAHEIWDEANRQLTQLDTLAILKRFDVALIGTTEDPAYSLEHHRDFAALGTDTTAVSAWRPDKAIVLEDVPSWNSYVDRLGVSGSDLDDLLNALATSHDRFHRAGSRISDHGLRKMPRLSCTDRQAQAIYKRARNGETIAAKDRDRFLMYTLWFIAQLNCLRDWVMQLHLGAFRNVNTDLYQTQGLDVGGDSIGDDQQGPGLKAFLGSLAESGSLPRTILYNVNPRDNHLFATMAGNFYGEGICGKVQFGSGWWFLDQKRGMTEQLNTLSDIGLLSDFVGMITDSRSLMSYPRHEYFRRVLCNLVGQDVDSGELPSDANLLSELIRKVCYTNARDYFGIELKPAYSSTAAERHEGSLRKLNA